MNHLSRSAVRVAALAISISSSLCAQWSTVAAGSEDHTTQASKQRSLAFAPSRWATAGPHTAWSLVRRASTQRLILKRSMDGGQSWDAATWLVPGTNHGGGAIVMGNDCRTLHMVYGVRNSSPYQSVYYRAFDTVNGTWLGAAVVLAAGTASNDDYGAADIEVTHEGRIVVAYAGDSSPSQSFFNGSWSTVLRVAAPPAEGTPAVFPPAGYAINTGYTAVGVNIQAVGETVHCIYRSAIGGYGIYYRGFDAESLTWNQSGDVPTGAVTTSNIAHIAVDNACAPCGRSLLYVLYSDEAAGYGRLMMTLTSIGNPTSWTTPTVVTDDVTLVAGNEWYTHYSLAVGEDRRVFAFYSKQFEDYQNLYYREYQNGIAVGTETLVDASTINGRYRVVNGHRNTQVTSDPYVLTQGTSTSLFENVRLYRHDSTARAIAFGRFTGTGDNPRIHAMNAPQMGSGTMEAWITNVEPGELGFLVIGLSCIPETPLIPPLFVAGSYQLQDWLIARPYQTQPCPTPGGYVQIPFGLPTPDPALIGASLYLQAVQSTASTFPFKTSNSLAVVLDM